MGKPEKLPDDYGATIIGNTAAVRTPSSSGDTGTDATVPGTPVSSGTVFGTGTRPGSAPAPPTLEPGTVVADRYQIVELLGEGGMGAVYKAQDLELERTVALKTILPQMASNVAMLARFKQEVLLASQITHRNVVRLYDLGESDGLKFITMEFVDGQDLRSILHEHGKFAPAEAVSIIRQVCRALEAAHAQGVIHRDLKPQNIMREQRRFPDGPPVATRAAGDRIVVMDFGLARTLQSSGMTQTGALVGTMEYMSPEQALGEDVDARSDLFAVGLIFYELLTGQVPYRADSAIASLLKRTQQRATPVSDIDASVPAALSNVVGKCLERDRNQRYQTAEELLQDLEIWQSPSAAQSVARPVAFPRPTSRRRWYAIGAAVLAVALTVTGVTFRHKIFTSSPNEQVAAGPALSVAILPFRNASGDKQLNWLGASLADMLSTDVGQSAQLRTVASDRVRQVLSDLKITPESPIDPPTITRLAQFSNADVVVWGQYVKLGERVRIDLTFQDLKRNRSVPLKAEAASEKDLLGSLDQLAKSIRENLALAPDVLKELQATSFKLSSTSLDALRNYDQGVDLSRTGKDMEAVKRFEEATRQDPRFAMAYSKLAQSYSRLKRDPDAEQASRKALELSQQLPAREKYVIEADHARLARDYPKAIDAYENLARVAPGNTDVLFDLAGLYENTGKFDTARADYSKVLASDPKRIEALLGLGRVEIRSGNPQASLDPLNRALTLAIQLDNPEEKALVLQAMGIAFSQLNKPDDALNYYQQSLDIKRKLGQKAGMADSLNMMAQIYDAAGKSDLALKNFTEAVNLRREIGDKEGLGNVQLDLGQFYVDRGKFDQALTLFKESLQIQRDAGNQTYEALCLNNIGNVYLFKGDFDNARTYFEQALQLREKFNVPSDLADTLHNLAETATKMGQYDQALSHLLRALDLRRTSGDVAGAAKESSSLGDLFESQGRYGAALKSRQEAVDGFRKAQDRSFWMCDALSRYGEALILVGRFDEAAKPLDEAMSLARQLNNQPLVAQILGYQADRLFYRGDLAGAAPLYQQAKQASSKASDQHLQLVSDLNLARLAVSQQRGGAVMNQLRHIAEQADAHGLKYISVESSVLIGETLIASGKYPQAQQELQGALNRSEKLGARMLMIRSHFLLAKALQLAGNANDANDHYRQALGLLTDIRNDVGTDDVFKRFDLATIKSKSSQPGGQS